MQNYTFFSIFRLSFGPILLRLVFMSKNDITLIHKKGGLYRRTPYALKNFRYCLSTIFCGVRVYKSKKGWQDLSVVSTLCDRMLLLLNRAVNSLLNCQPSVYSNGFSVG